MSHLTPFRVSDHPFSESACIYSILASGYYDGRSDYARQKCYNSALFNSEEGCLVPFWANFKNSHDIDIGQVGYLVLQAQSDVEIEAQIAQSILASERILLEPFEGRVPEDLKLSIESVGGSEISLQFRQSPRAFKTFYLPSSVAFDYVHAHWQDFNPARIQFLIYTLQLMEAHHPLPAPLSAAFEHLLLNSSLSQAPSKIKLGL